MSDDLENDLIQSSSEVHRLLLEHNLHRWGAEEENARRLGTRAGQLFTLITALLILGLFKVSEGVLRSDGGSLLWVQVLATAAIGFLLWALESLLRVRASPWLVRALARIPGLSFINRDSADGREVDEDTSEAGGGPSSPKSPLASTLLAWPQELLPQSGAWEALDAGEAIHVRNLALQEAVDRLHESNLGAATANGRSQERLFAAGVLLGLVLVCYLYTGASSKQSEAEVPATSADGDCPSQPIEPSGGASHEHHDKKHQEPDPEDELEGIQSTDPERSEERSHDGGGVSPGQGGEGDREPVVPCPTPAQSNEAGDNDL